MNISKLKNIAWAVMALMLTATTVMGQGWRNENRRNHNSNVNCMSSISGLSEKQQKQIKEMEIKHSGVMAELRTKSQLTTNAIEKSELRTEMLKNVDAHRNSVKAILTAEQQKQFEQLHERRNFGQHQKFANQHGNGNFQGRGNGRQHFAQKDACNSTANFKGRGGNIQNGNGKGKRTNYANRGNGTQGRNANLGRRNNRFNYNSNCNGQSSTSVDTCGFKVIEEKEFEE